MCAWVCVIVSVSVCALSHSVGDGGAHEAQGTLDTWVLILVLPLSHQLVLGRSLRVELGLQGRWSWV